MIDDLYGFLQYLVGGPAVTRHLEIDYLAPVLLGQEYNLEARLVSKVNRRLHVGATMTDPDGNAVLTSTATFVLVDVGHFTSARDGDR